MTENTLFTLDLNEMQLKIVHEALEIAFGATIDPTYAPTPPSTTKPTNGR